VIRAPAASVRRIALIGFGAAVGALALTSTAGAASDVQVVNLDCELHPRKIAIQNNGDIAQDLTGWKLLSNKPNEVYELSGADRPGQVAPGQSFFVFNGHLSEPAPYQSGGSWIYPWNYTPVLDESFFVLFPDGTDFIRLVDASGFPWREVSSMRCPDNPGPIPPLEQPQTPTPAPSNPTPGPGGNTGGTDSTETTSTQSDSTQSTGTSQSAASSGNTGAAGASGSTGQAGNVSGQAAGGPASGVGVLSSSGSSPFAGHLLFGLLGLAGSGALSLLALRLLHRALRRP
jgi:hypothetical protein